jgi:hypothetical protein
MLCTPSRGVDATRSVDSNRVIIDSKTLKLIALDMRKAPPFDDPRPVRR